MSYPHKEPLLTPQDMRLSLMGCLMDRMLTQKTNRNFKDRNKSKTPEVDKRKDKRRPLERLSTTTLLKTLIGQ
ncbi:hypothetical protein CR513_21228, partial [Mucuna pruriens]